MTPKKIYRKYPDIEEKVMQVYPVKKKERSCATKKANRDGLRWELAKKLYETK